LRLRAQQLYRRRQRFPLKSGTSATLKSIAWMVVGGYKIADQALFQGLKRMLPLASLGFGR
jgi:hypothetical protein